MSDYDTTMENGTTTEQLITLPDDNHVLSCWKVRPGTFVRRGETVALAVKKKKEVGSAAEEQPKRQYNKRRQRRQPVALPLLSSSSSSDKVGKLKLSTTGTSLDITKEKSSSSLSTNVLSKPDFVPLIARMDGILKMGAPAAAECKDDHLDYSLVKGYIEVCLHPTKSKSKSSGGGSYSDDDDPQQQGDTSERNASRGMLQKMTVSGGITVSVSDKEVQLFAQDDAERLRKLRKLSLVLDLDHTLVHATGDSRANEYLKDDSDVRSLLLPPVPVMEGGDVQRDEEWKPHFLKLRPHVKEFLSKCQTCYEIGVYTAGTREYAEQVTLILARHLVGSNRDQIDLVQLRQQVLLAEAESARSKLSRREQKSVDDTRAVTDSRRNEIAKRPRYDVVSTYKKKQLILRNGPAKSACEAKATNGLQHLSEGRGLNQTTSKSKRAREESQQQGDSGKSDDKSSGKDSNHGTTESNPLLRKRRKRVAFGEPPPLSCKKNDVVSDQELANLRKELAEAERLEAMAKDMRQRLFGGRVVSRTDVGDLGRDVKSLKRIFPCGGTMAAVVDDREDVWANAQEDQTFSGRPAGEPPDNLLLVRPYHHWDTVLGFANANNNHASGIIDLSAGPDDARRSTSSVPSSEQDQQLLWTTDILLRLHQRYYKYNGDNRPSVPQILAGMRREVLTGCNIVLSGLIPLHKQNTNANPVDRPRPQYLRYVENLGGRAMTAVTRETTHAVGARDGTDKILAARKVRGCIVVKHLWLMECVWSLTRRDERQHLL